MGHNQGCSSLRNRHKCSYCQKGFMMDWAKTNHQKMCAERELAMKNHPERYT